jgi:hypothetical protein
MGGVGAYKFALSLVAATPYLSGPIRYKMVLSSKFQWTDKEVTIHLIPWPAVGVRELQYTFPLYEARDLLFRQQVFVHRVHNLILEWVNGVIDDSCKVFNHAE